MKPTIQLRNKPLFIVIAPNKRTFKMIERYFSGMTGSEENFYRVVRSLEDVPHYLIDHRCIPPHGIRKQVLIVAPIPSLKFFELTIWIQKIQDANPEVQLWNYGKTARAGFVRNVHRNLREFRHKIGIVVDNIYNLTGATPGTDSEGIMTVVE